MWTRLVRHAQPTGSLVISEIFSSGHFKISHNQLITQICNGETKEQYPWTHELRVPIIDNPDDQTKLFDKLEDAFSKNPETNAVIVKGNLLYHSLSAQGLRHLMASNSP